MNLVEGKFKEALALLDTEGPVDKAAMKIILWDLLLAHAEVLTGMLHEARSAMESMARKGG